MGVCLHEWRTLRQIDKATCHSDPRLAGMLTIFTRLAADADMPRHERLEARVSGVLVRALLAITTVLTTTRQTARHAATALACLISWRRRRRAALPRQSQRREHYG